MMQLIALIEKQDQEQKKKQEKTKLKVGDHLNIAHQGK
jgi:hypothetical protein